MKKQRIAAWVLLVCMLLSACQPAAETDTTIASTSAETEAPTLVPETTAPPETTMPPETTAPPETTVPETTAPPETEAPTEPPQTQPPETQPPTQPPETQPPTEPPATQPPQPTSPPTTAEGYGLVPESGPVDKSYFDDAAFVGDSISLKLSYYQAATHALGNAQFFTAGSLSAYNALWAVSDKSVHPSYQGTKMLVEDCIQRSGAKKVYIMLGMNDIGLNGLEASLGYYKTLIARIKEKSPDVVIFVESMTPMASTSNIAGRSLNNTKIKEYNQMLLETCKAMGWYFVDVGSVMYDESGLYLNPAYCGDLGSMGIHFTNEGCARWVNYLLTHTVSLP